MYLALAGVLVVPFTLDKMNACYTEWCSNSNTVAYSYPMFFQHLLSWHDYGIYLFFGTTSDSGSADCGSLDVSTPA